MRVCKALFFVSCLGVAACASKHDPATDAPPVVAADTGVEPARDSGVAQVPDAWTAPVDSGPACVEGALCDDGNACTEGDRCHDGRCQGTATTACGPVVQEWGTYTSVQGTNGRALGGVHHVDEKLPSWVTSRNWTQPSSYFFESLPEEPLQQLETPVIYFWSPVAQDVKVKVDFPRGVIGEWFPGTRQFTPELEKCTAIAGGSMTWDVTVDPAIRPSAFNPVDPGEIWAPSRNVASTPVRVGPATDGGDKEQFIFYRGLATFEPPVSVVASADGQVRISNSSKDDLPAAFVLRVTPDGARIVPLGRIAAGETRVAPIPEGNQPLSLYVEEAQRGLQASLVGSGLKDDVAKAMVDTWTRSWFKNQGLRILYVAPRSWPDAILPLTITPTPAAITRTLVGRIEVITPAEELDLIASIREHAKTRAPFDTSTLGRFAEPRLRRAVELLTAPGDDLVYAKSLLDAAHTRP